MKSINCQRLKRKNNVYAERRPPSRPSLCRRGGAVVTCKVRVSDGDTMAVPDLDVGRMPTPSSSRRFCLASTRRTTSHLAIDCSALHSLLDTNDEIRLKQRRGS